MPGALISTIAWRSQSALPRSYVITWSTWPLDARHKVFSLEDGLRLVAERARLMQSLPQRGAIAVVFADPAQVVPRLSSFSGQIAVAAVNGPKNTVISGEDEAVRAVLQRLESEGISSYP